MLLFQARELLGATRVLGVCGPQCKVKVPQSSNQLNFKSEFEVLLASIQILLMFWTIQRAFWVIYNNHQGSTRLSGSLCLTEQFVCWGSTMLLLMHCQGCIHIQGSGICTAEVVAQHWERIGQAQVDLSACTKSIWLWFSPAEPDSLLGKDDLVLNRPHNLFYIFPAS